MGARGAPKTGGRRAGIPNKKTQLLQDKVVKAGLSPLEFLIQVMNDTEQTHHLRVDAAKAAAPYVHSRLAQIQVTGDPEQPLEHHITIDTFTRRVARLASRAAEDEGDSDA